MLSPYELARAPFAWRRPIKAVGLAALLALGVGDTALAERLAGSEWRPVHLRGAAVEPDADVFVQFKGAGRVVTYSGCRLLSGKYQTSGERLEIGSLTSASEPCSGPDSRWESSLLSVLGEARQFHRETTQLTLIDSDGQVIAELRQTDAD